MKAEITGGKKLKAMINRLKPAKSAAISYGYYPDKATYPNGLSVAQVAFWNEYGTERIPERPFFRHANRLLGNEMAYRLKGFSLEQSDKLVHDRTLHNIGEMAVNNLKQSVTGLGIHYPANVPATIKAKKSSKPLIDTGRLLNSPAYQVVS